MNYEHLETASRSGGSGRRLGIGRLNRNHFAFLRGWAQGVDPVELWNRYMYLHGRADSRSIRNLIGSLRRELQRIAKRHGLGHVHGLLRRDPALIAAPAVPTLDEFAEQFPPGFHTERELVQLWQQAYGDGGPGARAAARRARLQRRLLALFGEIERLNAAAPCPTDDISAWLPDQIAAALEAAGMRRIEDLQRAIRGRRHWYRAVRGIGRTKANDIARWLQEVMPASELQREAVAVALDLADPPSPAPTLVAPSPAATPAAPVAASIDAQPALRTSAHAIAELQSDQHAVAAWLRTRAANPSTKRAYAKEAQRFLLWCVHERCVGLRGVVLEDCVRYVEFLEDVGRLSDQTWALRWRQPQSAWCGTRHWSRLHENWRPFEGRLSHRSRSYAVSVIRGMFRFLLRVGYVSKDPWTEVPPRLRLLDSEQRREPLARHERSLSFEQWDFVLAQCRMIDEEETRCRLEFILRLGRHCGLRAHEMAGLSTDSLVPRRVGSATRWFLRVFGKGGRFRTVPCPEPVVSSLCAYMQARGLGQDPADWPSAVWLIDRLSVAPSAAYGAGEGAEGHRRFGVTPTTIYRILKAHFVACAKDAAASGPREDAEHLERASTHWLRHTCGTHAVLAGIDLPVIQAVLGHSSLTTTSIYVRSSDAIAFEQMAKLNPIADNGRG